MKKAIFLILFLSVGHLTVSQNTSFFKEERTITYEKLNEFFKYVKYKEVADEIMRLDSIQISYLNESVSLLKKGNQSFQEEVRLLESRITTKDKQIQNREEALRVVKADFRNQLSLERDKKLRWGIIGLVLGVLIGGTVALNI